MYAGHHVGFRELQCLIGDGTLQQLQYPSLINMIESGPSKQKGRMVKVVLHDVLLRMAERMQGKNHRLKLDGLTASVSLTAALKVCTPDV